MVDKLANLEYTEGELDDKALSWLKLYIVNNYEDAIKIGKGYDIMTEAIEMVRSFLNDPVVRNAVTNEEMEHIQELEETREMSKIEGKIEGENSKSIEIAMNMLEEKEPLNKIAKFTGLTKEEIKKLSKSK